MPIYVYQIMEEDGSEGEIFEMEQSMKDPALKVDPETGKRVKRVYLPPNLAYKHTPGRVKSLTADEHVEKKGFTKYVRDKVTGRYHKTAGKDRKAPDVLDPK
jgi:hypothetical protein